MLRARMWLGTGICGLVGAVAWALAAVWLGMEFGLLAWVLGACVGLGARLARDGGPTRPALSAAAMLVTVASLVTGRVLSLRWLPHSPGFWETVRWIDLLWLAMGASAAQLLATINLWSATSMHERSERGFSGRLVRLGRRFSSAGNGPLRGTKAAPRTWSGSPRERPEQPARRGR